MLKIQARFNNLFWLISTYLLAPLFYSLIFLKKKQDLPTKILVVSPARIGDLACITPVFREIRNNFPSAYLTVITTADSKDLLRNNPHIDEVISVTDYPGIVEKLTLIGKLRKRDYDWAVTTSPVNAFIDVVAFWSLIPGRAITTYKDLGEAHRLITVFNNHRLEFQKNTRVLRHCLDLLKFMGIKESSEKKELFIKPEEEKKVSDFLRKRGLNDGDLLVGISVTSGVGLNEWFADRFAQLADRLIKGLQAKIVFIGSAGERPRVEEVQKMMENGSTNTCGEFKLYELPALLKRMKLFISGDVGPLYVADAVDTPTVAIFGPNNAKEQSPQSKHHRIIYKDIYCAPCSSIFLGARVCKEGHLRCLKEITVDEVFGVVQDLIKEIENNEKD